MSVTSLHTTNAPYTHSYICSFFFSWHSAPECPPCWLELCGEREHLAVKSLCDEWKTSAGDGSSWDGLGRLVLWHTDQQLKSLLTGSESATYNLDDECQSGGWYIKVLISTIFGQNLISISKLICIPSASAWTLYLLSACCSEWHMAHFL